MQLDPAAGSATYQQVAQYLRDGVREGRWKPGERLPSAPELARDLGIAKMTALKAVQLLQEEGLAVARVGSGTYVAPPEGVSFADVDPRAVTVGVDYYGPTPVRAASEVPKLVQHAANRNEAALRMRVICSSSERWSWTWRSGKPSADAPADCRELAAALDALSLPKGSEVRVRGRRTLPDAEVVIFSLTMPDRTSRLSAQYFRPAPHQIGVHPVEGERDQAEVTQEWFERQWT